MISKLTKTIYVLLLTFACQGLLLAEPSNAKPAVEFSCLVWEPLPIKEVFYRDGTNYLPLEFSPGTRSKLYPLTQAANFELFQREMDDKGTMVYKLIGRAPRIAGTKRMLFFIEPYPTPTELPLKILGVDDAINAFPPGTYRFVNSSNAELQIKFGGQTNRLPAKEIILVKSNVPKDGGFMPFIIANSNGETVFETRIYSQSNGRNMVFINPPAQPGERVKIKMLPQLVATTPAPAGKTSPAAP